MEAEFDALQLKDHYVAPTLDWFHCANDIIPEQSRLRSVHQPEEQCPHYAADACAALWETACRLLEVCVEG